MLPYAEPPLVPAVNRPEVLDKEDGPAGRSFRLRFTAGQSLPTHRNAAPITITVEEGAGLFTADGMPQQPIAAGDTVRLEAGRPHSVVAGEDGLLLHVALSSISCECC